MMIKNKKKLLFLCLLVILIVTAYISFVTGTIKLSFNDLFTKFTTGSNEAVDSIIDLRLPRILITLMVGTMLAVSGALLQSSTTKSFGRGEYHWRFFRCTYSESTLYVVYSTIVLLLTIIKFYWRFNTIF